MNTLFKNTNPFVKKVLAKFPELINSIIPMNKAQRNDLVYACRDLSQSLTSDRKELAEIYWSKPRLLSAYFHYFLPWNLIRLTKLFSDLNFGKIPENPLIVDLGSGPLTLPLALWLARPDLRQKEVHIVACDLAPQPLNLGKKLFLNIIQEFDPSSKWKISTIRTPLYKALGQINGNPWLISLGNVLNEMEEKKNFPVYKQIEHLVIDAEKILREDGKIFAVEPGTRQGARVLSQFRHIATQAYSDFDSEDDDYDDGLDYEMEDQESEASFMVLSPCSHNEICPLFSPKNFNKNSAWCHFNCHIDHAPVFLKKLSEQAGLDKKSLSLSFLFLAKINEAKRILKQEKNKNLARIISDAFVLPDYPGRARYACHEQGLLLLPFTQSLESSSLCNVEIIKPIKRDFKSKAIIAKALD